MTELVTRQEHISYQNKKTKNPRRISGGLLNKKYCILKTVNDFEKDGIKLFISY